MTTSAPWYSRKPYLHFDLPLREQDALDYVTCPKRVASHAFYPLIQYKLFRPRIIKCPLGLPGTFIKEPKERVIAYPAHKDGYIFSYYKSLLEVLYEQWLRSVGLGQAVTAFRRIGRNNVKLAKEAFDFIKDNPSCYIIATDIEAFFDNIDHQSLKQAWQRLLETDTLPEDHYAVYKAVTRYSVVERHKIYNLFGLRLSGRVRRVGQPRRLCTPKQFRDKVLPRGLVAPGSGVSRGIGIPQGTSISPLLSNLYLGQLDIAMHEVANQLGGRYWRYCDDVLIVLPNGYSIDILPRFDHELGLLQLNRNKAKTQELYGSELFSRRQLQYLGLIFNGDETLIRPSSLHRYHRKMKKGIRAAVIRRDIESERAQQPAPLRQQALYNMYSELPVRGKKVKERKRNLKYSGNFIKYICEAAKTTDSSGIRRQQRKALRRLRSAIRTNAQPSAND